jgi:hypothetical protein
MRTVFGEVRLRSGGPIGRAASNAKPEGAAVVAPAKNNVDREHG